MMHPIRSEPDSTCQADIFGSRRDGDFVAEVNMYFILQVAGDASLELHLSATNAVKSVALRESDLPSAGCAAGTSLTLHAEVRGLI